MRVSIDVVLERGGLCEAAICYTGDLTGPDPGKYDLAYYVGLAKELEAAGSHILGLKDMGGLCKPAAARKLVTTLKQEVGIPIHFHTHDTSGIAAASVLAAAEAGVDAADGAMGAMSGLTSQPNLGSIAEALAGDARDPGLRPGGAARHRHLLGGRAPPLRALRKRHAGRHRQRLRARHAGRPVHQPARAGPVPRPGAPLAGRGDRLRPSEPAIRRHHQGDPDLQGGRRHGAFHGDQRPDTGSGRRPGPRDRVSGIGHPS